MKAIQEYNKKLPKKRKIKDKIGECTTSNITATYTVLRKPKKKNGDKPPPEVVTHYKAVGITDGCRSTSWSQDKFSLCNKQDAIQRSASAIKIRTLRTQYQNLLLMDPPEPPKPDDDDKKTDKTKGVTLTLEPSESLPVFGNAFENSDDESVVSLSVYNGPEQMAAKKPRPLTT